MGRSLAFLFLFALGTLAGCSSKDDPVQANGFTLTIMNETAAIYEVWIDSSADNSGYQRNGSVGAASDRQIDLDVDVTYVVRLVPPGLSVETGSAHEKTLSSSGADVTWTIRS